MGFIDVVGVSEENLCDVKYKLKNVIIKPNSKEDHSINVELEFEIYAKVFENKEVNIIQDLYSPSKNLTFKENKVSTMVNLKNTEDVINIREKIRLEDIEYTKICDVQLRPVITENNITRDKITIEGEVKFNFLLTNNNEDNVITLNREISFNSIQNIEGIREGSQVNIYIVPKFREFVVDDMEVTAKVDLELDINSYNLENVNVIDDIEETEANEEHPYSMVIYFVKPGDTLWKIAKKYKSTIEDIARINNIENPDKIDVGMQLFIPKCSICGTAVKA